MQLDAVCKHPFLTGVFKVEAKVDPALLIKKRETEGCVAEPTCVNFPCECEDSVEEVMLARLLFTVVVIAFVYKVLQAYRSSDLSLSRFVYSTWLIHSWASPHHHCLDGLLSHRPLLSSHRN